MDNINSVAVFDTLSVHHLKDRLKALLIIVIVSLFLGTWRMTLQILAMTAGVSVVFLTARVLHRFVGCILWLFVVATLALLVHDVDTLLAWTLGFLFGALSVVAMNVFLNTAIHPAHLIIFAHLMLFLAGIYAKVVSMSTTTRGHVRRGGVGETISSCFFWGVISGAFYVGILEELAISYS